MHIGMLSMDYPPRMAGGTTIHTYNMAKTFSNLGHTPYVIAAGYKGAPSEEHGNIEVRRVSRPYTLFSALKAGSLRNEMDVMHGHGTCAYGFMKLYEFPTVIKMHSTWRQEYEIYKKAGRKTGLMPLYVRMDRYCATHADAVIAISNVIKEETMRYGVPDEKITVIHNGIDPIPFQKASSKRHDLGIGEDSIVIGYIGRLSPHKGVVALANSFLELSGKYDNIHLLVVGDGSERSRMDKILSKVKDRVTFTGYVPHSEVPDYYATADIMTYPTSYEPLGNVIIESMAAGVPLVASKTGGIPEIFSEKCGVMIEPPTESEYNGLTEALETLLSSDTLRKNMGKAGHKEVKRFSWSKVCKSTLDVLEGVLHQ